MRILFCTHVFAPGVGGIETVSQMLAEEFVRQGHQVTLVTHALGDTHQGEGYRIHRRPTIWQWIGLLRRCDVCFHNNISLRAAWPLLLVRRPWVVAHHVWIPHVGLAGRLKRWLLRWATGISASQALAAHLDSPSTVIPNPYDDARFRHLPEVARERELVFVGRLVSDKGVHVLLDALALLALRGMKPGLTVVGTGPEDGALQTQARTLGIAGQVRFPGGLRGEDLVRTLNEHRILVVPSVWQEPFGLVALEGLACGCLPVVSGSGGLPEAAGPCGVTFKTGVSQSLADVLQGLLIDSAGASERMQDGANTHLVSHRLDTVAARYLAVFTSARKVRSV
jgi:glycosyltransferase involved in cell wall biosynthesis